MKEAQRHYYWLDLMRFVAALMVVLAHCRGGIFVEYGGLAERYHSLPVFIFFTLTRLGTESVIVFFVLSGFLVGGKAIERICAGSFRTADYAIDRFSRIMTPLVPALGLTALVCLIMGKEVSVWHFFGNLMSLQGLLVPNFGGNAPLWSLAYEVWFYILMGAIGFAAARPKFNFLTALLVLLVAVVFTRLSPTYLFCWIIGAFAFLRQPKISSLRYWLLGLFLMLYGAVGVELGANTVSLSLSSYRQLVMPAETSKLILASGVAILVQQLVLVVPRRPSAIALNRLGTVLAVFSYTLYLCHYPLLELAEYFGLSQSKNVDARTVGIYLLVVAAIAILSWLLYLPFEKQTPLLRKWIKGFLRAGGGKEVGGQVDAPD